MIGLWIASRSGMQHSPKPDRTFTTMSLSGMAVFPRCDDDQLSWMRRRLRTTLCLGALLLGVQTLSALTNPTRADRDNGQTSEHPTLASQESAPQGVRRAVLPVGWRRTAQGWQHVSTWRRVARNELTLSQRIVAQQRAEPLWLRAGLAKIRRTPPGCFAMAQLLAVGILFLIPRDQTCPPSVR